VCLGLTPKAGLLENFEFVLPCNMTNGGPRWIIATMSDCSGTWEGRVKAKIGKAESENALAKTAPEAHALHTVPTSRPRGCWAAPGQAGRTPKHTKTHHRKPKPNVGLAIGLAMNLTYRGRIGRLGIALRERDKSTSQIWLNPTQSDRSNRTQLRAGARQALQAALEQWLAEQPEWSNHINLRLDLFGIWR
jgi:hypothetical protein